MAHQDALSVTSFVTDHKQPKDLTCLPLLSGNATSVQMFFPEVVQCTVTLIKTSPALHADSTCVFILKGGACFSELRHSAKWLLECFCIICHVILTLLFSLKADTPQREADNEQWPCQVEKPKPTLLFDSYFLFKTAQQGGGAARKEQSFHLLLPTCLSSVHPAQNSCILLYDSVCQYVCSCAVHAGLRLPLRFLRFCVWYCSWDFNRFKNLRRSLDVTITQQLLYLNRLVN